MKIGILGGGLSGISLACFLQQNDKIKSIDILEKESTPGGLCRSFDFKGVSYDIGPHIIFSKDNEILEWMIRLLGDNVNKLRRLNKIYYQGLFIHYPLENALSELPAKEREYCLRTFLDNPYKDKSAENLHQFFLKKFGEGITGIYLKPYNEKIWKCDPASLDTQMVDRIPLPPDRDIVEGARGHSTDGHLHQLHFYYPRQGGIQSLIHALADQCSDKVTIMTGSRIAGLTKTGNQWKIETAKEHSGDYDLVVSTLPLPSLAEIYRQDIPEEVMRSVNALTYNSIMITVINVKKDIAGNHFAVMVPDQDIIFHRVSRIDFLGDNYRAGDHSTNLMAEITYAKGSPVDKMSDDEAKEKIVEGLEKIRWIDNREQVVCLETRRFEFAYVVYDLNHKKNVNSVRNYFHNQGIKLCGRFGEFEYWNMDAVIRRAKELSEEIGETI